MTRVDIYCIKCKGKMDDCSDQYIIIPSRAKYFQVQRCTLKQFCPIVTDKIIFIAGRYLKRAGHLKC